MGCHAFFFSHKKCLFEQLLRLLQHKRKKAAARTHVQATAGCTTSSATMTLFGYDLHCKDGLDLQPGVAQFLGTVLSAVADEVAKATSATAAAAENTGYRWGDTTLVNRLVDSCRGQCFESDLAMDIDHFLSGEVQKLQPNNGAVLLHSGFNCDRVEGQSEFVPYLYDEPLGGHVFRVFVHRHDQVRARDSNLK